MAQERVVGYVVGSDISQGREVWKVKSEDGNKFKVASVHGDIALAPGLNVSFMIGTFKEGEQSVRKAVDVRLLSETREELRTEAKPSSYDSLSLVVVREEDGNEPYVWLTSFETEQEARDWANGVGTFEGFAHFDIDDYSDVILDFGEAKEGFIAINAISRLTGVNRALEELLMLAYKLGQAQSREN